MVEMVRSAGDRSWASEVAHWSCPARSRIASASSALPISHRPTRRMSPPTRSAAISAARKNSDACWAQKSSCSVPLTEMAPVNASARRAATSGSRQPATGDQAKVEGRSETLLRVEHRDRARAGRGCRWSARRCRF